MTPHPLSRQGDHGWALSRERGEALLSADDARTRLVGAWILWARAVVAGLAFGVILCGLILLTAAVFQ